MVTVAVFLTPHEGLTLQIGDPGPDAFIGARRAMDGWLRAMARAADRLLLFTEASHVDALRAETARYPAAEVRPHAGADRVLREARDAVICHPGQLTPPGLWRARSRWGLERVPIISAHHTLSYPHVAEMLGRTLALAVRPHDAIVASSADAETAIRRMIAEYAPLAWPGRIERIPLGIDTGVHRPLGRAACRADLGLPPDAFVALWAGRLSPVDKADLVPLLLAFRRFALDAPGDCVLVLAGRDGIGYGKALGALAERLGLAEAVVLAPDVPADRMPRLYSAADVLVSPVDNVQEAFGLTVVEALAAGLPCVVSDWAGYRDTVTPEVGLRVPTRWHYPGPHPDWDEDDHRWERTHLAAAESTVVEPDALVAALRRLRAEPATRAAMSAAARARAVAEYDWDAVIARHLRLCGELLAAARPAPSRPRGLTHRFAHYATSVAEPDPVLAPGWGDADVPVLADLCGLADVLRVRDLIRLHGHVTVPMRLSRAVADLGLDPAEAARAAAWLLKTGLLTTPAADPAGPLLGREGGENR